MVYSVGEWVNGQAHTNGIESFWSMLKRGYHGTNHRVSPKHLDRYVCEFAGRHNQRPLHTAAQMGKVVVGFDGERLLYAELIAGARGTAVEQSGRGLPNFVLGVRV